MDYTQLGHASSAACCFAKREASTVSACTDAFRQHAEPKQKAFETACKRPAMNF